MVFLARIRPEAIGRAVQSEVLLHHAKKLCPLVCYRIGHANDALRLLRDSNVLCAQINSLRHCVVVTIETNNGNQSRVVVLRCMK